MVPTAEARMTRQMLYSGAAFAAGFAIECAAMVQSPERRRVLKATKDATAL
jgi:hypothetical protein